MEQNTLYKIPFTIRHVLKAIVVKNVNKQPFRLFWKDQPISTYSKDGTLNMVNVTYKPFSYPISLYDTYTTLDTRNIDDLFIVFDENNIKDINPIEIIPIFHRN